MVKPFVLFYQHWLAGMHTIEIEERLIKSCRGKVNFGGCVFASIGEVNSLFSSSQWFWLAA